MARSVARSRPGPAPGSLLRTPVPSPVQSGSRQSTAAAPAASSSVFARLNGREPRKPRWADSGQRPGLTTGEESANAALTTGPCIVSKSIRAPSCS